MSPQARYFQGLSVQGPVKASPARDFRDVVDAFRICPTIPMTRAAFLALPKAERNEKKQVPFFTPACFQESPSKRTTELAVCCNLIFLDLDEEKDGHCPAAPFVRNPESLYTALEGLNFIAHTTASSTPEKPRMRIVIDAHEISIANYPKAVATIAAMLGLRRVTTESKKAAQPMFLPTLFADSTDDDLPLIAHRIDGRTFTEEDISSDGVEDTFGKNGHSPDALPHGDDAIFFLRAPVPEITLAVAKEALGAMDPDCSYFDWLEVAAALRHQFSPHHAEEAYDLFDEWSSTGTKYQDTDDTRAKWDSLRPTPVGRMPVTIRSLLVKAKAAGWNDAKIKENSFSKILDWMESAPTSTELLEQGVRKILAAPMLSNVQESMLVEKLRSTVKRRFGDAVQATAIHKDLARTKALIKAQERATETVKEPAWAKGVLYVSNTREYYRRRTGEKYKEEAFNAVYARHLLPKDSDLNNPSPAAMCKPLVEPADYALNHLKITTVTDYAYDPSQPTEMFFIDGGIKWVNTYNPTYPELDAKNAPMAGAMLLKHLSNLVGEEAYRRTLIDYMAFLVQFPGRKIRWAPMIQGAEGCGKTLISEMMKAVLGKEHVKTIDGTAVVSGWNEWATGYQLVVLEEVRVQGTNRYDIMNRMKAWVTNDDIPINEKFRNNRDIRNITNYMMFSNHHDALALTANNRRYFVIKSPLQSKAQVLALGEEYFNPLFQMVKDFAGGLRSFLAEWVISADFKPDGHAPRTKYADEMVQDSANDLTSAVRRLIAEGDYPLIQYDIVSAKTLTDVLRIEEGIANITGQQMAHVLREEGFHQVGRHAFGEERHYLWARHGVTNATEQAVERVKKDLKNLHMDLLFS